MDKTCKFHELWLNTEFMFCNNTKAYGKNPIGFFVEGTSFMLTADLPSEPRHSSPTSIEIQSNGFTNTIVRVRAIIIYSARIQWKKCMAAHGAQLRGNIVFKKPTINQIIIMIYKDIWMVYNMILRPNTSKNQWQKTEKLYI